MTASPWVIRGCRGCGAAIRRQGVMPADPRYVETVLNWYCSLTCARGDNAIDIHRRKIATTPLHILYPEMMQVLTWAQERRRPRS